MVNRIVYMPKALKDAKKLSETDRARIQARPYLYADGPSHTDSTSTGGLSMSTSLNSPSAEIEALEDRLDAAELMLARIESANDEEYPAELVDRLFDGENPVIVWRQHRELTPDVLAALVPIEPATLTVIEDGSVSPSLRVAASIARAVNIDLELLVPFNRD